ILHPSANPTLIEYSTAVLFITGNVPGSPSTTGSTCEFGSPPKPLAAPVNIFDFVASWTWISMPTRTRYDTQTRLFSLFATLTAPSNSRSINDSPKAVPHQFLRRQQKQPGVPHV